MDTNFPDVAALIARPHLAVVAILQIALEMTIQSLRASYPNLAEDPQSPLQRDEEDAYVDAVLHQAEALKGLLRSSNEAVARQLHKRLDDLDPRHVEF